MKQFVITESDFEKLLTTLELHKFKGGESLRTNVAIELTAAYEKTKLEGLGHTLSSDLTQTVMHDAHRTFLYHVHTWIQEQKR